MNKLRPPASRRQCLRLCSRARYSNISNDLAPGATHQRADIIPVPPLADIIRFSPETLNLYRVAIPPGREQLRQANSYFTRTPPAILFSASQFFDFPPSTFPEVAFLGRSNVGKSSLLNALFGRPKDKPAHVSSRPGRTRLMNGFGVGGQGLVGEKSKNGESLNDAAWKRFSRGGLVVVDMPGYGGGSRAEWGQAAMKYLQGRKQLRRTFVLIDTDHGLKRSDLDLLGFLQQNGIAYQVVMSKVDKLLMKHGKVPSEVVLQTRLDTLRARCEDVTKNLNDSLRRLVEAQAGRRGVAVRPVMLDVLCCSAEKCLDGRHRIGIDELRWTVMSACGIGSDQA